MVKLKLTAWAEESIKSHLDTFTTVAILHDPEVKAAYETGFIDFGDDAQILVSKFDDAHFIIRRPKHVDLMYDVKTWQVYNPPRISKRR